MKILLVIASYKPLQDPNILRWSSIIKTLISAGHQVDILTTNHKPSGKKEVIEGATVYRCGHATLKDKLYNLFNTKTRRHEPGYQAPRNNAINRMLEWLVDKFWRATYWPDGAKLFLKPGIKKGRELVLNNKYDSMISVGLPFTCHWITYHLKSEFMDIHWHMDIQDPFTYSKEFRVNNYNRFYQKNLQAERETFRKANSISVTNSEAKSKYLELFEFQEEKISIIPPLLEIPIPTSKPIVKLKTGKLHLVYFGSFYEGVRSPQFFLNFFETLSKDNYSLFNNIQLHVVGQQSRFSQEVFDRFPQIKQRIVFHGFKTRKELFSIVKEMDFIINIGNSTSYHLPSRAVEFLYFNKPIINFTSTKADSLKVFLKRYNNILHLNIEEDMRSLREIFEAFINQAFSGQSADFNDLKPYLASAITNSYLDLINKID